MIIRPGQPRDLENIVALQTDAILTLAAAAYSKEQAMAWARWQAANTPHLLEEGGRLFVGEDLHGLTGTAGWSPEPAESNCAWVRAVFVAPRCARQGVGRTLMARLEDDARKAGRSTLRLTASGNAREFYLSLGYAITAARQWEVEPGVKLGCADMERTLT